MILLPCCAMPLIAPASQPLLRGPVPLAHQMLGALLHDGDRAVDATCGNGNDTLLLARLVGPSGMVWGFDVQDAAIEATGRKLADAGCGDRVRLVCAGHEELCRHVTGQVQGVVFNLGYLPGSDRTIITRPETTGVALEQALTLLTPGGIVTVTVYPGHDGGAGERRIVDGWAARLSASEYHAWRMGQVNVPSDAPYFILVQKSR